MSVDFTCGDPAGLAGYLYDECDPAERAAIDAHLAVCPSCVSELRSLGATRTALAAWTPPDARLGFRITSSDSAAAGDLERGNHRVLRPARWWQRPLPAWAQAAAALLVFAVGMGLGMRTAAQPQGSAAVASGSPTATASSVSQEDLAALEARLRDDMNALRASAAASQREARESAARPASVSADDAAVMDRVRTLVAASEARQQRELAVRLTQALRDVDAQRRHDLVRIEQTFGQMEGYTRPELADQRQMINYLFQRTSAQRPPE